MRKQKKPAKEILELEDSSELSFTQSAQMSEQVPVLPDTGTEKARSSSSDSYFDSSDEKNVAAALKRQDELAELSSLSEPSVKVTAKKRAKTKEDW